MIRIQQEETIMLTRRGFAGFASCALCGLAEFAATEVSAQATPPPAPTGFTRKILSQMDGPMPGYVTLVAEVTIDPGTLVARHTHPGIESGYVVSGGLELPIQGQETPRRWSSVPMSLRRASRSRRRPRQSRNFDAGMKRSGKVVPSLNFMFVHNADRGRGAVACHFDSSRP
jgi:hypothetical protein